MSSAKTTTDHQTIKQWVEARGGCPASVRGTGSNGDPGVLRIDYPDFRGVNTLEPIDWGTFFAAFERNHLAFLYQDESGSRFSKFVARADGRDVDDWTAEPDAIELLERQHRDVERLFESLHETADPNDRALLFAELADTLAAHTRIEETLFYPAICDDATLEMLREAVDDHLAIKRMVVELLDMPPDDAFMDKLDELQALVDEHVDDEEQELFPKIREQGVGDLDVLGRELERRFAELIETEPRWLVPEETGAAAPLPC
jgi:hemerythrin superfamily protein